MKKFITLNKYGELYIDKILFETYFPIIFTCKNENNDIFICVCCQCNENGCKWLVGRTNGSFIVRMLQNEITIRQLLLDCCTEKISVDYKTRNMLLHIIIPIGMKRVIIYRRKMPTLMPKGENLMKKLPILPRLNM